MSEFGKLRTPNTSSGAISAGVIINELDLVNKLLARAQKAEAELERAQKMFQWLAKSRDGWKRIACDNEARAEKAEAERDELKRRAVNAEAQWEEWKEKAKKLFDQYAQVRDALEKAEEERDEWKRRAGNAEFEVNRQRDLMNPVDWERVRIEAAIATMQGVLANPDDTSGPEAMVYFADALVAELQKKEVQG